MALLRNLILVGGIALALPSEPANLQATVNTVFSGAVQAIDVASVAFSDAAEFCNRNVAVCATQPDNARTVAVETIDRSSQATRVIHRAGANTTILVRADS